MLEEIYKEKLTKSSSCLPGQDIAAAARQLIIMNEQEKEKERDRRGRDEKRRRNQPHVELEPTIPSSRSSLFDFLSFGVNTQKDVKLSETLPIIMSHI